MNEKQLVLVDPKEYGLEPDQAKEVESVFLPVIAERENLAKDYSEIISKEISKSLINDARELRLKLVKVRTNTDRIHKTAKAFYLAGGRFVDAWKNKNVTVITQMEERLSEIENYYINIEKERIKKLQSEREQEANKYGIDASMFNLGQMSDEVYKNYITGVKLAYDQRIEAERKAEEERIAREKAEAEERERIRKENEQLKKEAEERERIAKIEAEKRAKIERERIAKEEAERKKREDQQRKEREAYEAKLKAEREEKERIEREERAKREKLEAELKAKEEAERKAKEAEEARLQAELNKGDSDKVKDLISDLESLKTKYTFKSAKNKKMYSDVSILIDKIINHIKL